QPILELLKKTGWQVHFWPLPGLAQAPAKPLTLSDYVEWLENKTKSLDSFVLLGHSFGGQLAIRFARLNPTKVQQLILVDSSGILDSSLIKVIKRLVFKTLARAGKTFTQSPALRRLLYRFARETDYYEASPTQRATMRNILADEIKTDLPQIKTPTLVIWGAADKVTPLSLGRKIAQAIPQAQLKVLANARHSAVYTHPEAVVDSIKKFINNS
ncbi:MAG: alpha/beta hydrolase, partial [Candidatus Paceibacterota bacterium]